MSESYATPRSSSWLSHENVILVLMVMVAGVAAADRLSFNILSPLIMAEFGISNGVIGALTSAFSLAMAISAMAVGWLFKHQSNHKAMLVVAVLCFSVSAMLGGLVTSLGLLVLTRIAMGLSEGPVFPFAQSILVRESSPHRRAFNNSMTQTFGGMLVGAFVAPILLGYLAQSLGWRGAFLIIGIPGMILAGLILLLVRDHPAPASGEAALAEPAAGAAPPAGARRNVTVCILIGVGLVTWLIAQSAFLPLYLMNERGYDVLAMTRIMSMAGLGGVVGSVILAAIADRVGRKPVMIFACLLACVAPLGALYLTATPAALMATTLIGWIAAGAFGLYMVTIPAESSPASHHPFVLGLVLGLPEIVGGVVMPALTGRAADTLGLSVALWLSLGGAVLGLLLSFFLVETRPRAAAR